MDSYLMYRYSFSEFLNKHFFLQKLQKSIKFIFLFKL